MKAIILSAGQGSRLHPYTEDCPKCLLPIGHSPLLTHQIRALHAAGIKDITVVTGFRASAVEHHLETVHLPGLTVKALFNPFYNAADNLASCWMAREAMKPEFLLLNGDTLFGTDLCRQLLAAAQAPVTMAIDKKDSYDSDDMKVIFDGRSLRSVGKDLDLSVVNGESIGMMVFRPQGAKAFVETLDQIMRSSNGIHWWYLKAVAILATQNLVEVELIHGKKWCEVDFPEDLEKAKEMFAD